MKVETELGGLEYLFLLNVFGVFVALGLALSEYLSGVSGAVEPISTERSCLALAGVVFATGVAVTSVLLHQDPQAMHGENDVLLPAGHWTQIGGVGFTQDPVILIGVVWSLGGLIALSITIHGLFS